MSTKTTPVARIFNMLTRGCMPYITLLRDYGGESGLVESCTLTYPFRHFGTQLLKGSSYKVASANLFESDGYRLHLVHVHENSTLHDMTFFGSAEHLFEVIADPIFDQYMVDLESHATTHSYYEWLVEQARIHKSIPQVNFDKIMPVYVAQPEGKK